MVEVGCAAMKERATTFPDSSALDEAGKRSIIAGVLLAMLLAALDQTIVSPALPTIGTKLGDFRYLPWVITGYLLTATAIGLGVSLGCLFAMEERPLRRTSG